MVGEFKVLQSNYGAEHAKGPITIDVISKAGGRDFHGMGYIYLRDYRLNSNEWRLNKFSTEPGAENKPKNKYAYPGFNLGGPLVIPGTELQQGPQQGLLLHRLRVLQAAPGHRHPAVVGADRRDAQRRLLEHVVVLGPEQLVRQHRADNLVNGRIPANQIDPNGQALLRLLPRPNADPAQTGGYNYVESIELDQNMQQWLTRVDVNVSDNTRIFARYNLQTETQNFPVGLWWRNANQVPYPTAVTAPNRSHSATTSLTHVFGPSLTSESTFAATFIDFPNQLEDPSRVSRSALGYTNPGIYDSGLDQIPSMTGWGNGPTMFNPGGFDPVLFAKKWLISGAQSVTKVSGAHTMKAGAYYEWVNNSQPGNGDSNGRLVPSSCGRQQQHRQLLRRHAHRQPRRVRRAVAERRPRHGLQHLRGLHPGQLEGVEPADDRRRPPHVAPGRLVRAQRRRHGGVRSRALRLAGAGHVVPRPHLDGHQSRRPDVGRRGAERLRLAARRLRLRPLGRRLDAAPRRLRHVQLPRRAGAVLAASSTCPTA